MTGPRPDVLMPMPDGFYINVRRIAGRIGTDLHYRTVWLGRAGPHLPMSGLVAGWLLAL